MVTDDGATHHHDVLPQGALRSDPRSGHHVTEMPNPCAAPNHRAIIDVGAFMHEDIVHGHAARCFRGTLPFVDPATPVLTTPATRPSYG
jgi:hypothetical protein